jgi:undecaprenyl-diphosphatase
MAADIQSDAVVSFLKAFTNLGSLPVVGTVTVVVAAWLARRGHRIEPLVLVVGLALVFVLVHVAKDAYGRPRPEGGLVHAAGLSYPSAHAAYSIAWVAVAVAVSRGVPRLTGRAALVIAAMGLAAAIGLSRVELRAHYLTDVLGGWGLGAAIYALCAVGGLVVDHMRHTERSP